MKIKTLTIFQFFFLLIFSYLGIISFGLWQQVIDLRGAEISSIPFLQPHFLRYLLVLPIFLLSNFLSIEADLIFNLVAIILILVIVGNVSRIAILLLPAKIKKKYQINIFIFILMIMVAVFMNGRILFSMAGLSLILLSILKWENSYSSSLKLFISLIFGVFLCSVSSGTFLSSIAIITTWAILLRQKKSIFILISLLIFILSVSPLLSVYLMKNIDFYGGGFEGFLNMLNHGMGSIFFYAGKESSIFIITFLLILSLFCLMALSYLRRYRLILSCILISIMGGFFGYSTMMQGLPILISMFAILLFGGIENLSLKKAKIIEA